MCESLCIAATQKPGRIRSHTEHDIKPYIYAADSLKYFEDKALSVVDWIVRKSTGFEQLNHAQIVLVESVWEYYIIRNPHSQQKSYAGSTPSNPQ
jgi:ABC-type transporter lipoprotein component MlaA